MIDVSNPGRAAAVPARRRVTIASWMYLVAIVALDLAVAHAVYLFEAWRFAGIAPIAIALELGLFFLIRSRGRLRPYAFWAGFEIGGLLGIASFLFANVPDSRLGASGTSTHSLSTSR